jgi:hypothetical protein
MALSTIIPTPIIKPANDIVLIVLWILAAIKDISYLSVMICFVLFLVNDIYGYISWRKMERRQRPFEKAMQKR